MEPIDLEKFTRDSAKVRNEQNFARSQELWNVDPNCPHWIVSARGGGVKCLWCKGWFCI